MDERKRQESAFHDRLRQGTLAQRWSIEAEDETIGDPLWENFKYYSVERKGVEYMRDWLRKHCRGKCVLDCGCGNGEESILVAKQGASRVVGFDLSEVSIGNCRKRATLEGVEKATEFSVGDIEDLQYPDDCFDIAMEYGVLHHVELDRALNELSRVIKRDGKIICVEALGHNPLIRLYRGRTPHLRTEWEAEHILRKQDLRKMGKYFGRIQMRFFHLSTLAAVPFRRSSVFDKILRSLETLDGLLLRLPGVKWQAWMAVFILSEPKKSFLGRRVAGHAEAAR